MGGGGGGGGGGASVLILHGNVDGNLSRRVASVLMFYQKLTKLFLPGHPKNTHTHTNETLVIILKKSWDPMLGELRL